MLKVLLTGLWIGAVTLGTGYVTVNYKTQNDPMVRKEAHLEGLDYQKTPTINVPVLEDGKIHGYVIAQFVFTVDGETLKKLAVPPHAFVVDEAFRYIYERADKRFAELSKHDLGEMTEAVRTNVNKRFGVEIVQHVLVQDFAFHVPGMMEGVAAQTAG
ncbi:hypothetical protein E1162_05850 [Rhodobacteraceae bacterium RKSG542]|uniref:hypothetical protein n=1 Tax=Pseudovibrio flavus TaxID=2529854 RepID=UPI0012BB8555|nr:hypothetical protein [Pseudovibrio flavus]MTI16756.1 hypothetical protein [Pseudovibrio flavus]